MKQLIEDYKRRLANINEMIANNTNNGSVNDIKRAERFQTKASEYRTFISDLEKAAKNTDTVPSVKTNAKIIGVFKKIGISNSTEILLEISYIPEGRSFSRTANVKFAATDKTLQKFEDMEKGKEEKVYLANGMTDIDIYKSGKNYMIMNSPVDGIYDYYEISKKDFDSIKQALRIATK